MKQGSGKSSMAATKVEPRSMAINPSAVAEIGIHQVRTKEVSIHEGRGLKAPMVGQTNHKCGSQGRH